MQPSPLYSACTYSESVQLQRPARAQAAQGCVEAQSLIGIGLVLLLDLVLLVGGRGRGVHLVDMPENVLGRLRHPPLEPSSGM